MPDRVAGQPLPAKDEAVSYSPRQTRWLLTKAEAALAAREAGYLETLKRLCPQIAEAHRLLLDSHILLTKVGLINDSGSGYDGLFANRASYPD